MGGPVFRWLLGGAGGLAHRRRRRRGWMVCASHRAVVASAFGDSLAPPICLVQRGNSRFGVGVVARMGDVHAPYVFVGYSMDAVVVLHSSRAGDLRSRVPAFACSAA